jgi:tyrosinase
MHVEISIASTDRDGKIYLSWTPIEGTARLIDGPGAGQTAKVQLQNAGTVGKVVFDIVRSDHGTPTLQLDLPGDGSPVRFWVAGEFKQPSVDFGDAVVQVIDAATSAPLGSTPVMVRIRKNATTLTDAERDRFLAAFGNLNGQGTGRFTEFRDMHNEDTLDESHGNWGFLPWHRCYLLDLERQLQGFDPQVTLPYWRFDQPAAQVFTPEFMGLADPSDPLNQVQFTASHPFNQWTTEGEPGIVRKMGFPPNTNPPGLKTEQATIAFGNGVYTTFGRPVSMPRSGIEGNPHGFAHTSFGSGWIINPATAPRDPMFFLLHGNVDRLWAKWQWFYKRALDSDPNAFFHGAPVAPGHNIGDTMWPWNGVVTPPRPSTAPGGALVASALTSAPGPTPMVRSMIDYQGVNGGPSLGFDYDDVPFELPSTVVAAGTPGTPTGGGVA